MTNHLSWDASLALGDAPLDAEHQALLAQCKLLADLCPNGAEVDAVAFDAAFQRLKQMARAHFDAEAGRLAALGEFDAEALQVEREEFDYFVDEIATTENFDPDEVQRFVALWWLGHVRGLASQRTAPRSS